MNLSICSLNVRGLGDNFKKREVFNWHRKKKKYYIYMLQVQWSENTNPMCDDIFVDGDFNIVLDVTKETRKLEIPPPIANASKSSGIFLLSFIRTLEGF